MPAPQPGRGAIPGGRDSATHTSATGRIMTRPDAPRDSRTPDPMHFERHAGTYGQARPPYPPQLWARLRDLGLLDPGLRAIDLGAGTGQATGPMLAAGLAVTAIEPGTNLAEALQVAHPGATVIIQPAEDLDLPPGSFDIAVAATSIHWMDLGVLLPKVRRLLTPTGRLLVWRNVFGDPEQTRTPFRDAVARIVATRTTPSRPGRDPEDLHATSAALTHTGLFAVQEQHTYRWSLDLDEHSLRRLFTTFSDWTPDEVDQAARAVRDLGGRVTEHYHSWLIILSPREHQAPYDTDHFHPEQRPTLHRWQDRQS